MNKSFSLSIITPTETLLSLKGVKSVQVHLSDGGSLGILPGHAPLLAATTAGPVHYTIGDGKMALKLGSGILQICENQVTIFTSGSEGVWFMGAGSNDYAKNFTRLARTLIMTPEA